MNAFRWIAALFFVITAVVVYQRWQELDASHKPTSGEIRLAAMGVSLFKTTGAVAERRVDKGILLGYSREASVIAPLESITQFYEQMAQSNRWRCKVVSARDVQRRMVCCDRHFAHYIEVFEGTHGPRLSVGTYWSASPRDDRYCRSKSTAGN